MAGQEPARTPAPDTVAFVLGLASRAVGQPAALRSWTELARKSTVVSVARVGLDLPDGRTTSVIAKYALPEAPALLRETVSEELMIYRFLGEVVPEFRYAPALLAYDAAAMVLEDLGADRYAFADAEVAALAVAETLASLHRATAGREADHRRCRAQWGYPTPEADRRAGGEPMTLRVFGAAADTLAQWTGILAPDLRNALLDQIRVAEAVVRTAGPFRTLVHDDWVERRQSVAIDGRFHLVDFEHAKYFHCLSDLTKIMIGTLSNETRTGRLFHQHYTHSERLFADYRAAWEEKGGPVLPDATWRHHMVALLLFQAVAVVGRILGNAQQPYETSAADCIRSVLERLSEQTERIASGHPVGALAATLAGRILSVAPGGHRRSSRPAVPVPGPYGP